MNLKPQPPAPGPQVLLAFMKFLQQSMYPDLFSIASLKTVVLK